MQKKQVPLFREDAKRAREIIDRFLENTSIEFNKYNNLPSSNSIAIQEKQTFSMPKLVEDAHYSGSLSIEAAADHFMAFTDLITEPVKTLAPFTCIRGLLESSALAIWLLDPKIDVDSRIKRCFAFRYKGFIEQIKYSRLIKNVTSEEKILERIKLKNEKAKLLGYSEILDKKGNISAIGQHMPSIVELIELTLNGEKDYRILSAVAHGQHWAMFQIGFRVIEVKQPDGSTTKTLEKSLNSELVFYLISIAFPAFAKALWHLWQLYGWDLQEIKNLLDSTANELNYNLKLRFWHYLSL